MTAEQIRIIQAALQYLIGIMADGEYQSDWLTHLPAQIQPAVWTAGRVIVSVFELWF